MIISQLQKATDKRPYKQQQPKKEENKKPNNFEEIFKKSIDKIKNK